MEIEVYVVNRTHNASVGDNFTIQFGKITPPYQDDRDIFDAINSVVPLNIKKYSDGQTDQWGLNHTKFPTLCAVVKLKNDHPSFQKLNSPWFGAVLTLDEVLSMLRADL